MSLSWYIQRIKTFSPEEILFRVKQRICTHVLDSRLQRRMISPNELPASQIIADAAAHYKYPIFESSVDIFKPIDWHLDLSSGKKFPKSFSHKINIRSDQFGSAKHVWEVNRQLFLVHIAKLYHETLDRCYLDLIMYHLTSWKNENPYLLGVNWYSNIEVNIRLINWTYCWKLLDADSLLNMDPVFATFVNEVWLPLICDHADYSFKHPSLYSSANNHLISEYAGLFIAACCWNIPQREKRCAYAKAGLEREILLQNSPDGVNREEAAEYIQFIDDFFLLAVIAGDTSGRPFSNTYKNRLHQMARYLNVMLDVKYNYPMYGDGDDGFLLRPDSGGHFNNFRSLLTAFATYFKDSSLKRSDAAWDDKNQLIFDHEGKASFDALIVGGDCACKNEFFVESGHFVFRKIISGAEEKSEYSPNKEIYLHFDAAPLGYLSIAAHGHADALSFVLHVDGQPVIVDPGTYTYHTHRTWRNYFVSTLAHNTVRVNEMNQALQAGPTLWLKHFKTKVLQSSAETGVVEATHNGYNRIGVSHSRKVEFDADKNQFTIIDSLQGPESFDVEIPFHLHPESIVEENGDNYIVRRSGSRSVLIELDQNLTYTVHCGEKSPVLGWYSEHFGEKVPAAVLYGKKMCHNKAVFVTKIKVLDD